MNKLPGLKIYLSQSLHSKCKSINTQIWSKYRLITFTHFLYLMAKCQKNLTSRAACNFKYRGLKQGSNVLQILTQPRGKKRER